MSILKIIRWICGYVKVKLSGDNTASFLNFCLQKKIAVWNVEKSGDCLFLNISLSNYMNIRNLRHEFGHKILISHISFIGFPKKIYYINKRKSVFVGFIFFCMVLFAFSQFVWKIEIVGNKNISDETIISAYSELGVHTGMLRSELDTYALRDRLPLMIREISWCSFNLEGTKLTINVTEINEFDKTNKNNYSNLIAATDGIIKKLDIVSGNKVVNIGYVVRKGDVLVSGAPELNVQQFTHSEGSVIAETNKTITVKLPKYKTVVKKSGLVVERTVVDFFGIKFPTFLDNVHFEYQTEFVTEKINFLGEELPINLYRRRFIEVLYIKSERSHEDVINDAKAELISQIKQFDIRDVIIDNYQVLETDDYFSVEFKCKCLENIAQIQKINVAE